MVAHNVAESEEVLILCELPLTKAPWLMLVVEWSGDKHSSIDAVEAGRPVARLYS